jgi:tetratricopeptide (TPR) repeat protein
MLRRSAVFVGLHSSCRSAVTMLETALELHRRQPDSPPTGVEITSEIGEMLDFAGDLRQAEALLRRTLETLYAATQLDDTRAATTRARLGHVLHRLGRSDDAVREYRQALRILRAHDDPVTTARTLVDFGVAHWSLGRHDEAATAFLEALALLGDGRIERFVHAYALAGLGTIYQDQGDLHRAAPLLTDARDAIAALCGIGDHTSVGEFWDRVGYVKHLLGDLPGATAAHEEAERMIVATAGADDPRRAMALTNLGLAHHDAGRIQDAVAAQHRALEIFTAAYGADHPYARMALDRLAAAQGTLNGEIAAAAPLARG